MATKLDRTSFSTSNNLKTAFTSKPDAIAKALIKVVNAATNFRLG